MCSAAVRTLIIVWFACLSGMAAAAGNDFARFEASVEAARAAMVGDPNDALVAAEAAVKMAALLPASKRTDEAQATAGWLHAESLIYLNQLEEAGPIVKAALANVESAAPNSKLHGDLLRSQGALMAAQGHMLGALRDYQRAFRVFRSAGVERSQAMALQDIGLIYFEAQDYTRALDYYNQSVEVYSDDPVLILTMHNNRAEVLRKQGRHAAASREYQAALRNARDLGSALLVTRILTNLAGSQVDESKLGAAGTSIAEARRLADHGDAAGWRPFVDGVAAKIALRRGNTSQAERLIERAFEGQKLDSTELLFREYHQTAAAIYERTGNETQALAHVKAFQRLDAEALQSTASTASQLMGARFDFANQNLKIANLKQGQLERDIQIERQKARLRNAMLIAGAILLALLCFSLLSIRRSRNDVRAANKTLIGVNAQLEKALEAKTEFLATTSHEIRTPLNGILGMTQVLLADRALAPDIRDRIEVVHGAGETMRALVDDILDMAKIESGKIAISKEQVDLIALLQEGRRLWSDQAAAKGLDLVLYTHGIPGPIMADGGRLRQIISNLLSNAVKFTLSGQVRIEALVSGDASQMIEIRVVDTGIGIPAASLEEIFEPFRQVQGGTSRQFSGTGLGLAICRRLIHALGGSLAVESIEHEGSTFIISLPLELADPTVGAQTGTTLIDDLAEARLLIVEENARNLGIMSVLLSPHVASVTRAQSLEEANEAMSKATHLVVSTGAAGTGSAALRSLVEAAQAANALITLLHSTANGLSASDMMTLGADQIIIKPVSTSDLLLALQSMYGENPEPFVAPCLLASAAA